MNGNRELVEYWHTLVLENGRASAPAWHDLIRRLRAGQSIPGVGTWRNLWAAEHGGIMPAVDARCPYSHSNPPRGWSMRTFARIKPDKFALLAARKGMGAALTAAAPMVQRTRVGLAPCQCVQIDDMWHEVKVAYLGNRHAQRVVELKAQDVLTGKVLCHLLVPVREGEDGARQTLRARWVRYLIDYVLTEVGIPAAGCTIMGERGTATLDAELTAALGAISDGAVRFRAGGLITGPLAQGLPGGQPKGNPRFKGLVEQGHRIIKDLLGVVQGNVGGGRGVEPEAAYGMTRLDEQLRKIADALEAERPGISRRLRMPFIPLDDFAELVNQAYDIMNGRTAHEMEGWEQCGFVAGELLMPGGAGWVPAESIFRESETVRTAIMSLVDSGAIQYRQRRLSPAEAFASRSGELHRLDRFASRVILGDALAVRGRVSDRLQIAVKSDDGSIDVTVSAVLADGRTIERGSEVMVWFNPLIPDHVQIADGSGRHLGETQIITPARTDDDLAIQRQLGTRQRAIAAELRRLAPTIRRRQRAANEAARINAIEILGYDPAEMPQGHRNAAAPDQVAAAREAIIAAAPGSIDDDFLFN